MKERIIGIDVARALAVIGMILVNFKVAFGDKGSSSLKFILSLLEGKAAATFVVLAGIGIAFLSKSAIKGENSEKLKKIKSRLLKRSLFLFVVGLAYLPIWPADILHFYGVYMLITLLVLTSRRGKVFGLATFLVVLFPVLMLVFNYDLNWDYKTYEYVNFWTPSGFVSNLMYNGFHPVVPWSAFMLIGLWFGRYDLRNTKFLVKSAWLSFGLFVFMIALSKLLILMLSEGSVETHQELQYALGTSPMPPLPIYMISGSSFAIFIISVCILIAKKLRSNPIINALKKTGQLALTFYVAHVVIGMLPIYFLGQKRMGNYSIEFSTGYALIFSGACIAFAILWTKYKPIGPLEGIMRKITD
ncbi:DUF418 domain-containing protein [Flagellimonas allohymeniacidonis]|uniref:DUF418 domain-containing protein n=1 Tax=Flagellimonas allohymeniacidonis TaxID=2517819 RepID=A0A4Q8QF71_9FLAO|nr:DUF418 domain-containing protein [Allomuricauda hymeniacidonis]TAI46736.1 DUF418 domain-containing protein [Allomuricauda hymeniacidonis]